MLRRNRYAQLPRTILLLVSAQFMLSLVNSAFILILNIYLRKLGYSDAEIAGYSSYRFLVVLLLAFPLGIFIKGKPLKPFFIAGSLVVPLASVVVLQAVTAQAHFLTVAGFLLWGTGFMLMHVCVLPFLMRATPDEMISEAISLSHSTWSLATIVSGLLISILSALGGFKLSGFAVTWDEASILYSITLISIGGFFLVLRIEEASPRSASSRFLRNLGALRHDYDWDLLLKALTPTLIIAVGAGLTIPFVNLFFNAVFEMDSEEFSLIGSLTAILVFGSTLFVPSIKRRFGFGSAILIPQIAAVLMLVIMASTELMSQWPGALAIAIICYMLRQPLMNMANPMTSELTMKYVGEQNQELISAITSSVWSGSWFLSARIFQLLRSIDLHYYQIFLITAALYGFGVLLYTFIIREYQRREAVQIVADPVSEPEI